MLRFGVAVSTAPDRTQACRELLAGLRETLGGPADLVVVYLSMEHAHAAGEIATDLTDGLETEQVIGCTAQGVIAGAGGAATGPAIAVWAARLPGVQVRTFALDARRVGRELAVLGWPSGVASAGSSVLLLADPFTFPAEDLLAWSNREHPGMPVVGGLASGSLQPGRHRLLHGARVLRAGAVGAVLNGPLELRPVVSQGCRPVGQPLVVTAGEGRTVRELAGRPAVDRLRALLESLGPEDQVLLRMDGIQIGQVLDEQREEFDRGDFLVSGLAGVDPHDGSLTAGAAVQVGQIVQFHLRDARAADEEFRLLLEDVPDWAPESALLTSCQSRGGQFFGQAGHDAALLAAATRGVPTAGFFSSGEFGPVGGRNFLHSSTASAALFRASPTGADN